MTQHSRDDIVRTTGHLLTRMNPTQLAFARIAAGARGMHVTEYLRVRLVPRILTRRSSL